MDDKQQIFIVFDGAHMDGVVKYCRKRGGEWIILEAFKRHNERESYAYIQVINVYERVSYNPDKDSGKVNGLIYGLFENCSISGVKLKDWFTYSGVPMLKVKDNDLMVYVYNVYFYLLNSIRIILNDYLGAKIFFVVDRLDKYCVPEWPSYNFMLDQDVVMAPWVAFMLRDLGYTVVPAGIASMFKGLACIRIRSFLFGVFRIKSIVARSLSGKWHVHKTANLDGNFDIICTPRSKTHVKSIGGVLNCLRDVCGVSSIQLADDSFRKDDCWDSLQKTHNLYYAHMHSFLSFRYLFYFTYRWLRFRFIDLFRVKYEEQVCDDVVVSTLLSKKFKSAVIASLAESILTTGVNISEICAAKRKLRFRIALITNPIDQWANVMAFLGKHLGFKVVSLQNVTLPKYKLPSPYIHDEAIVFDSMQAQILKYSGKQEEQIFVLGNPLYDNFLSQDYCKQKREVVREQLGVGQDKKLVLYALQSFSANAVKMNMKYYDLALALAKRHPSMMSLLKLHPYEKIADYDALIKHVNSTNLPILFTDEGVTEDIVMAADVVVSGFSTTMLAAVLCGVPTIAFLREDERGYMSCIEESVASECIKVVSTQDDALDAICTYTDSAGYKSWSEEKEQWLIKHAEYDGKATMNVAHLIAQLLNNGMK